MGAIAAARFGAVIFGAALVFAGVVFAGTAIMLALSPHIGLAGAAAATAGILLFLPIVVSIFVKLRTPRPLPPRPIARAESTAMLAAISAVAVDRPLLAVLGAGVLGVVDVLLKQRR
jgi:hypothetical protein